MFIKITHDGKSYKGTNQQTISLRISLNLEKSFETENKFPANTSLTIPTCDICCFPVNIGMFIPVLI
jgi:hypothetical protein